MHRTPTGLRLLVQVSVCILAPILFVPDLSAQQDVVQERQDGNVFDEQFDFWPVDLTIGGSIVFGTADDETLLRSPFRYLRETLAGQEEDEPVEGFFLQIGAGELEQAEEIGEILIRIENTDALDPAFEKLQDARFVALCAHSADEPTLQLLRATMEKLKPWLAGGKTLYVDSRLSPHLGTGLIPDCVMMTGFDKSEEQESDLLQNLAARPRSVGIGLADDTVVRLAGRKMTVFAGEATFALHGGANHEKRIQHVKPRRNADRRNPYEYIVDLTAWRRDSIERSLPLYPPAQPPTPHVSEGSLIIIGGGGTPREVTRLFFELAGGPDARLVYVPCLEDDAADEKPRIVRQWESAGVESATWIHTKDRNLANGDAEFLKPLENATGIFFGGGRQWNLADSYYGTVAHRMMKQVLDRGGVIAGSSAGASIQGGYLARANPVANFDIMAPGYERGLGFLRGVAIDQHFSQRRRQGDMESLVVRYPQLLGFGIDEQTALVVRQSEGLVMGPGKVWFYDQAKSDDPDTPCEPDALPAGSRYDLATRVVLEDATPQPQSEESGDAENDSDGTDGR